MEEIQKILFLKRFCLPCDTNIKSYQNGTLKHKYICGNYYHISCIIKDNIFDKNSILSIGMNQYSDKNGLEPTIHAEHNVLNKLKQIKYKKKLQDINLLVIRVTKKNELRDSKPCSNCIKIMSVLPQKKGYKIKNIYYSDNEGKINKTTLTKLQGEEQHVSGYYKKKYSI